jgi:hypothetical protein
MSIVVIGIMSMTNHFTPGCVASIVWRMLRFKNGALKKTMGALKRKA